jgi:two-component system sensor histidine kinase ChiS
VRGLDLGAADCVEKPFEPRALLAAVERALKLGPGAPTVPGIDPDTGLIDAESLWKRGTQEEARARRYSRPFSVAVIALQGKRTPQQVAEASRRLREAARPGDVVAHLGDGNFAALLLECDAAVAQALAERLAGALGNARARAEAIVPGPSPAPGCEAVITALVESLRKRRR